VFRIHRPNVVIHFVRTEQVLRAQLFMRVHVRHSYRCEDASKPRNTPLL
jgi:hypothetical protein